jgi:hypothetical protein
MSQIRNSDVSFQGEAEEEAIPFPPGTYGYWRALKERGRLPRQNSFSGTGNIWIGTGIPYF